LPKESAREYRIAARAGSSVLFRPTEALRVTYRLDGVPIQLTLRTRYHNRGFAAPVPGDLWLDARGGADDLKVALARFTNAGRDIANLVSLSTNAAIAPLEAELGYETTAGITSREYLQRFLPTERMAYTSRFVDVPAVQAVVGALDNHQERDRLTRAASQYSEALRNWRAPVPNSWSCPTSSWGLRPSRRLAGGRRSLARVRRRRHLQRSGALEMKVGFLATSFSIKRPDCALSSQETLSATGLLRRLATTLNTAPLARGRSMSPREAPLSKRLNTSGRLFFVS
jgi:hypothetical protein